MAVVKNLIEEITGDKEAKAEALKAAMELQKEVDEGLSAVKDHVQTMGKGAPIVDENGWIDTVAIGHAINDDSSKNIGKEINQLVGSITSGDWKNALSKAITTGVTIILGNSSSSYETFEKSYCHISGAGGVVRTDLVIKAKQLDYEGFEKYAKQVTVAAWRTGAIDIDKVDINTVLAFLPQEFDKDGKEIPTDKLLERADTLASKIKKLFEDEKK